MRELYIVDLFHGFLNLESAIMALRALKLCANAVEIYLAGYHHQALSYLTPSLGHRRFQALRVLMGSGLRDGSDLFGSEGTNR